MNHTNEKTKLSQLATAIIFALIGVCFIKVMAVNPIIYSPNTHSVHTEREITVGNTNTYADETEQYAQTVSLVELAAKAVEPAANSNLFEIEPEPRYYLADEEKHMLCYVADSEDFTSVDSRYMMECRNPTLKKYSVLNCPNMGQIYALTTYIN